MPFSKKFPDAHAYPIIPPPTPTNPFEEPCVDFRVQKEDTAHLLDERANAYLQGTLDRFRDLGINLIPLQTHSDGSCLTHAVSRSLIGYEIHFDILRHDLHKELIENESWYRANIPVGKWFDAEQWRKEFVPLITAAAPTRGLRVQREKWLEDVHILGLANVLKRPIVLLNAIGAQEGFETAMILPLRFTREEIVEAKMRVYGPIFVGWAGADHSHYVGLSREQSPRMFTDSAATSISRIVAEEIPENAADDESDKSLKKEIKKWLQHFALLTPVGLRRRALTCMLKIFDAMSQSQDGLPGTRSLDACCQIPTDNRVVRFALTSLPRAIKVLKCIGFAHVEVGGRPHLRLPVEVPKFKNNIILQVKSCFNRLLGEGACEGASSVTVDGEREKALFGEYPKFCSPGERFGDQAAAEVAGLAHGICSWDRAREVFADGPLRAPADHNKQEWLWNVGDGFDGSEINLFSGCMDECIKKERERALRRAVRSFYAITEGVWGEWSEAVQLLARPHYGYCPHCRDQAGRLTVFAFPCSPLMTTSEIETLLEEACREVDPRGAVACPRCAGPITINDTILRSIQLAIVRAFDERGAGAKDQEVGAGTGAEGQEVGAKVQGAEVWSCPNTACMAINLPHHETCFACAYLDSPGGGGGGGEEGLEGKLLPGLGRGRGQPSPAKRGFDASGGGRGGAEGEGGVREPLTTPKKSSAVEDMLRLLMYGDKGSGKESEGQGQGSETDESAVRLLEALFRGSGMGKKPKMSDADIDGRSSTPPPPPPPQRSPGISADERMEGLIRSQLERLEVRLSAAQVAELRRCAPGGPDAAVDHYFGHADDFPSAVPTPTAPAAPTDISPTSVDSAEGGSGGEAGGEGGCGGGGDV